MAGFPQFPIQGSSLSKNVGLDRISVCENTIGNARFPVGQYVFFIKNQSVFYRYKNTTTPWTNDKLLIVGATQQNTKFDLNGNPVTAFKSTTDNSLKVQQTIGGIVTTTLSISGSFPTVVIYEADIYVFWVPVNYTNYLLFAQDCDSFSTQRQYNATLPGNILMMNIQVTEAKKWLFTFECQVLGVSKTYIAFTNPEYQFATSDLLMFTTFLSGTFLNEYFVIAENGQTNSMTLSNIDGIAGKDSFNVSEISNSANLTLIKNSVTTLPEYFLIAQESDKRTIIESILSAQFNSLEAISIQDDTQPTGFQFTPVTSHHPYVADYFIISETAQTESQSSVVTSAFAGSDGMMISDLIASKMQLTFSNPSKTALSDVMAIMDLNDSKTPPTFVLSVAVPFVPKFTNKEAEYFVINEIGFQDIFLLKVNIFDYTDGAPSSLNSPLNSDKFYINDTSFTFVITTLVHQSASMNESFTVSELVNGTTFSEGFYYKIKESLVITDATIVPIENVAKEYATIGESLQIQDVLDTLFSETIDYTQKYIEPAMLIAVNNVTQAIGSNDKQFAHLANADGFKIDDNFPVQSSQTGVISLKILKDIGAYTFVGQLVGELEHRMLTFSSNSVVPLYYYVSGAYNVNRPGPMAYNILISEAQVSYFLA